MAQGVHDGEVPLDGHGEREVDAADAARVADPEADGLGPNSIEIFSLEFRLKNGFCFVLRFHTLRELRKTCRNRIGLKPFFKLNSR